MRTMQTDGGSCALARDFSEKDGVVILTSVTESAGRTAKTLVNSTPEKSCWHACSPWLLSVSDWPQKPLSSLT